MGTAGASRKAWTWTLAVALLPVLASAIFAIFAWVQGTGRFDAAYFEPSYREAYSGPGATLLALCEALRSGDDAVQCELQGRSDPYLLAAVPDIEFGRLLRNGPVYVTYLLYSPATKERFIVNFEQVGGRWVFAPRNAYLYLHSGLWIPHALRLGAVCWLVALVLAARLLWRRRSARRGDLRPVIQSPG